MPLLARIDSFLTVILQYLLMLFGAAIALSGFIAFAIIILTTLSIFIVPVILL